MNHRNRSSNAAPPGPSCFPFVAPAPSSFSTPRSNAAIGPSSEDAERNQPPSEAPSEEEDLASWENPDLNIFAPAVPPEQNRPQDILEGRSLYVNDDGSDISTLTTGDGAISLSSSVLNPGKRVLPVIAKPVDLDEVTSSDGEYIPDSSGGGALGWWGEIPRWVKLFSLVVFVVLVVVIAVIGVGVGTGAFSEDNGASGAQSQSTGPPSVTVTVPTTPSPLVTPAPTQKPTSSNSLGGPIPPSKSPRPTLRPTTISSTPAPTTEEPETEQPETEQPETEEPQTEEPQTEQPQTEQPQTEQPQTEQPQTEQPQTSTPKPTEPTQSPTEALTEPPTEGSTPSPTEAPQPTAPQPTITKFYVMGSQTNDQDLQDNLPQIPNDFDWVIHLGDFSDGSCSIETYKDFDLTMSQTTVPVFILPGENEWNNCVEPDQAWEDWTSIFSNYNTKHWSAPTGYSVSRQSSSAAHVEQNFAFPFRGVLHVGMNMVVGTVQDSDEWDERLQANLEWITENINAHRDEVRLVLIYGNSGSENQGDRLDAWYQTLEQAVRDRSLTTVVVNEDQSEPSASVKAEGGSLQVLKFKGGFWPPLRVTIDTGGSSWNLDFQWF